MPFSAKAVAVDQEGQVGFACEMFLAHISNIGEIYRLLGLNPDRFERWTIRFGADCRGRSDSGELLVPGFPIFSKIAWMDIDDAVVEFDDLPDLVQECKMLAKRISEGHILSEVNSVQRVAECAIRNILSVKFCPA